MNLSKLSFSLIALCLGISLNVQAQSLPEIGGWGIRANVTGQNSLEIPYMINESLSLAPYISLQTIKNGNTDLGIGIRPRYYLGLSSSLGTYATGTLGFLNSSSNNNNVSATNYMIGVGFGAEYFVSNQFSVSADLNLNSQVGDNPNRLFTLTRFAASFYF